MRRFLAALTLVLAIIPGPLALAQRSTQVHPALQQSGTSAMFGEADSVDYDGTVWSRDGTVGLVTIVDANQQRHLSLGDIERGTTTPLADAGAITVSLSPDGAWAVYSTIDTTDAGPVREVTLLDTATGTTIALRSGLAP